MKKNCNGIFRYKSVKMTTLRAFICQPKVGDADVKIVVGPL